jgi:sporadic carbohydrate cluster protein (TIGR04323 family)
VSKKLQGYIFSREFGRNFVPQRVQNLVIKNYVQMNDWEFLLSATEYGLKNCYMMLSALSKKMDCDGVVLYTVFLLPEESELRNYFLSSFISRGKEVHFALEGIILKETKDFERIDDIFFVQGLNSQIKAEESYMNTLKDFIK